MAGALSSLGAGSGVLTFDVIDQLRKADEEKKVKPITTNKEKGQERMKALSELTIAISEFKAAQNPLAEELTYLQRTVDVTGDEAEITVEGGVNPQTINLHIDKLAKQDIIQSKNYATADSVAVLGDTDLNVFIDDTEYTVKLKAGMTLSEMAAQFSVDTSGKIVGSALKVGGEDPYKLVLKSAGAGDENRILMGTTKKTDAFTLDESTLNKPSSGDLIINGVDIFQSGTTYKSMDDVIAAINAKSDDTNVKAFASKDGKELIFNNANGGPVDFTGSNFGYSTSTVGEQILYNSGDYPMTINAGDIVINGYDPFTDGLAPQTVTSQSGFVDLLNTYYTAATGLSFSDKDGKIGAFSEFGGNITFDGARKVDLGLSNASVNTEKFVAASEPTFVNSGGSNTLTLNAGDVVIGGKNIFNDGHTVSNIQEIVDGINAKTADTNVQAVINDGKIELKSTIAGEDYHVRLNGSNKEGLRKIGFYSDSENAMTAMGITKEHNGNTKSVTSDAITETFPQTYGSNKFSINGTDILAGKTINNVYDVAKAVNEKFKETSVSAEVVDGKLRFNNSMGSNIVFTGDDTVMTKLGVFNKSTAGDSITGTSDIGSLGSNHRFDKNDLKINNINIFDDNTKPADNTELVALINAKKDETGVEASINGGKLVLNDVGGKGVNLYGSDDDQLKHLGIYGLSQYSASRQIDFLKNMGLNHDGLYKDGSRVQEPQSAEFFFNGVKITRNTNEVDDLIVGAKITLLKVHEKDDDIVKGEVKRDSQKIIDSFKEAMEKYNSMVTKIKEVTNYNYDTKEVGALQGVSEVTKVHSTMSSFLLHMDSTLGIKSLVDLGLSVEKDGSLKMDYEKLEKKVKESPEDIEKLFRGYDAKFKGKEEFQEGIWTKINNALKKTITDDDASLKLYEKKLKKDDTDYDEEIKKAMKDLDTKFEIMQNKFASYDTMIGNMKNKFAPVQAMIAQSYQ
jgi:flagellar capping protein FliD